MSDRATEVTVQLLTAAANPATPDGYVLELLVWLAEFEEPNNPGIIMEVLHSVLYVGAGSLAVAADATGRHQLELLNEAVDVLRQRG